MTTTIQQAFFMAGVGIIGIFAFMTIFYLLIKALDRLLPYDEEEKEEE
jgi:hypothetical protein